MKTVETAAVAPKPIPLNQMVEANQRTLAAAARLNARLMRDMMRVQKHMLDFVAKRLETDIETAEAIAKCGDAPEVMAVAQEFCAKAMSDYAQEATDLMRIGAEAATAVAADTVSEARSADARAAAA
jgi:hypothetical protein